MILNSVKIRNFRCFTEVDVKLDEFTVLIGENNSGKTSFLDALRLCLSRNISRQGAGLDDYDYHLSSETVQLDETGELKIMLDFVVSDDDPNDIKQTLGDVIVFDEEENMHVILQLSSGYNSTTKNFESDWNFLDCTENSLGTKTKRPQQLYNFLQLTPLFYLLAFRDVLKEFNSRSMFWAPFLRYSGIPEEMREKLQEKLNELNNEVLRSHSSLQKVKSHLAKVQSVVLSSESGTVDIQALPGRIIDLLSKTQINFTSLTGAHLPLERQGSGTQSLAVIFLFEAFLATMISEQYTEFSTPILTLEEPEAHLHPCAIRSLWNALKVIPGQKVIATHSGDLIANVPLTSIRRFYVSDGKIKVKYLKKDILSKKEQKKIEYHIQSSRGELLFARCWLLCEGESEFWIFTKVAEILNLDLDKYGVRVVNTRHSGVETLVKTANELGIIWYFVGDGDNQGQRDGETCKNYLENNKENEHIHILSYTNMEVLLCSEGFGNIYENNVSPQKKDTIIAKKGTNEYWEQVTKAQPNKEKPVRIREVMFEIQSKGKDSIPNELITIIKAAIKLAKD